MVTQPGKVLIVYDELEIVNDISDNLKNKGYFITVAKEHKSVIEKAHLFKPDLVIIDTTIPNLRWEDVVKELKNIATIFIIDGGINGEEVELSPFQMRNSIYKPIKAETLILKIETALGNNEKNEGGKEAIVHGDFEINKANYSVYYKSTRTQLARKEFELLYLLASKPGRVFLRSEILQRVWGTETVVSDRTIDVHIRKIRRKLGCDLIKTVIRVGYKFQL